ncbi:sugar efflux transporter [Deinococcus cellulosilyticus]|uniref:Putative sugar efflux transporter n=1 Tax=Deinococcus cellulosilyticus (strain DSM 18568 / NBRC 106333 / KACC 11606 / 5516J-15) TaxID=1223518 RepID=A0A511N2S3_DEIC1|nr:sugar efflux transporter [Deinococcus cellulosilyticus]GEM46758.1 putative sugar efflux transporter [Deinococcus cellulosilyticus NBRC 106333 = KACC 11606]
MKFFSTLRELFQIPGYLQFSAALMMFGIAFSYIMPYTSLFATTEAHMSKTQLGIFVTSMSVASIVISTRLAQLSDRAKDRRWILLLALLSSAVGYLLFSEVRNFYVLLLIACTLLAIGSAAFPQLFAFARIRLQEQQVKQPELAISTLRTFFSLAWVIGPATGALLLGAFGFPWLYRVAALCAIAAALIVYRFKALKSAPRQATASQPLSAVLKSPTVMAIFTGFTLLSVAGALSQIALPLRVVQDLHGTKGQVGLLFSLAAGLEIPFMIFFGIIAAKLPKSRLIIAAAVLQGVYFLVLSQATHIWQIFPAQILTALVISVTQGLGISYFQDLLPEEPGMATTLNANTNRTGSILSGLLFGTLGSLLENRELFLVCMGMCWLCATLLYFFGREKHLQAYHKSRKVIG